MTEERATSGDVEYHTLAHIAKQLATVLDSEAQRHIHLAEEELTDEYCGAAAAAIAPALLDIMRPEAVGLADAIIGVVTLQTMLRAGHTLVLRYDPAHKLYGATTEQSIGAVCSERFADLLVVELPNLENEDDEEDA